jgi:hypothetical protein
MDTLVLNPCASGRPVPKVSPKANTSTTELKLIDRLSKLFSSIYRVRSRFVRLSGEARFMPNGEPMTDLMMRGIPVGGQPYDAFVSVLDMSDLTAEPE